MKSNKLMAAAIVLSFSSIITTTAYAGKVVIRNCTSSTVEVQTYNSTDETQTNLKDSKSISESEGTELYCGTTKCGVAINNNYKGVYSGYRLICPGGGGGSISNKVSLDRWNCAYVSIEC